MRDGTLQLLRALAARTGVGDHLRRAYNALAYAGATSTVRLRNIQRTFRTPTGTIREHVESFAGEEAVLDELLAALRPGDCFWDTGASFGLFSLFAAGAMLPRGDVHAFEPEARMRRLLKKNVSLNSAADVTIHSCALGERNGATSLYRSATPNIGTSALAQREDYRLDVRGVTIPIRRGDDIVAEGSARQPTALKIDVEGAEGRVLAGLEKTLRDPALRFLACEVHPRLLPAHGDSAGSVEEMITRAGLAIYRTIPRGTEYHILCRRDP